MDQAENSITRWERDEPTAPAMRGVIEESLPLNFVMISCV